MSHEPNELIYFSRERDGIRYRKSMPGTYSTDKIVYLYTFVCLFSREFSACSHRHKAVKCDVIPFESLVDVPASEIVRKWTAQSRDDCIFLWLPSTSCCRSASAFCISFYFLSFPVCQRATPSDNHIWLPRMHTHPFGWHTFYALFHRHQQYRRMHCSMSVPRMWIVDEWVQWECVRRRRNEYSFHIFGSRSNGQRTKNTKWEREKGT